MEDPVDALVLDLLEWIGPRPRPYTEVMEAWRTSCPRLPVWEEANARGYVSREHPAHGGTLVEVSARGRAHLQAKRCRPVLLSCNGNQEGPSDKHGRRRIIGSTGPDAARNCAPF